jgi:PiT family inorganic phosphate transporter
MPEGFTLILLAVLGLAIAFDYINGFHDTANAIATSVSTRALKPGWAIAMSATANFVGALTGTAVAQTVGAGLVEIDPNVNGQVVIAAALVGAIFWNLLTWRLGIPSSSSHALIGGLLGATFAAAGFGAWQLDGIVDKVLVPLVGSPVVGFVLGLLLMVLIFNLFRRAHPVRLNAVFRRLQVLSAGYMAFSHGSNDAQKTMGIMTLALVTAGVIDSFEVPLWVIITAATAISLGTAAGGWRIIKTMGTKVVKLDPVHGFAAETTAASIIFGASHLGMPVSTTHVISSAIMGVGSSDRMKTVRWGVARSIVVAWVLTLPASGATAALAYFVLRPILGQ